MRYQDAYEILIKEYLDKCKCCDECVAEYYCIKEHLRTSNIPQVDCDRKVKAYFKQR